MRALERGASWGDELTLQASADAFGVVVHVVAAHDINWHLFYEPTGEANGRLVFLSYLHPVHYNVITDAPERDPPSPLL